MPMATSRCTAGWSSLRLPEPRSAVNFVVDASLSAVERLSLAESLLERRSLTAAGQAYNEAEAAGADPDRCSAGRWDLAMLAGRFEDAWRESDEIRRRGGHDPHRFWNGEAIDGRRVIVRSLHGLGDAVQMFRYAPLLSARAAEVIYEVPPRMVPLARSFRGVENVITWGEDASHAPGWDLQVEITELPYVFRTTVDQLPIAQTYLELPEATVRAAADAMGRRQCPRVGIVWACGDWNPQRNVPLQLLEPLLRTTGLEFWSLQGNGSADQAWGMPVRDERELCDGLVPLAAVVANLDLVITPDTLAGHLAGALGKPAWLMLQYAADWRWMVQREDSPWYRSVRLFRQPAPGNWESVVQKIQVRLSKYLQAGDSALLF